VHAAVKTSSKLSLPSSGRNGELLKILPKRDYLLSVRYEETTDELLFKRVEALRVTHYRACSLEMLAAYDTVTFMESAWLGEVLKQLQKAGEPVEGLRHLRLYLDDGPCYEFICHDFEFNVSTST
jgi:hypothetical protein